MLHALDTSRSALEAQRARMDAIAFNLANLNSTRNERGQLAPPARRFAVFLAGRPDDPARPGVRAQIRHDPSVRRVYDPNHPDARDGYVNYPDIDLAVEHVNALEASRAYEANVTAMEVTKAMFNATLRLIA